MGIRRIFGILALVLAGAALYWFRGRGWDDWLLPEWWGTQDNRLVWSLPTGTLIWWLSGAPKRIWPLCVIACFAALVVTGHGAHQDLGRLPERHSADGHLNETATFFLPAPQTRSIDIVGMMLIGCARMAVMAAPILPWRPDALLLVLFGPLQAPSYVLGWKLYATYGRDPLVDWGLVQAQIMPADPLHYAEFIWGGVQYVAILLVLWILPKAIVRRSREAHR